MKLPKLAFDALKGLVGIIVTAIVTALIGSQPLTGLVKLKGLYQAFTQTSLRAWTFAANRRSDAWLQHL